MNTQTIPNFLMSVDDDLENVYETSYTDNPATDMNVLYFSGDKTDKKEQNFKTLEAYERMTSGVWMMPNTNYIRKTDEGELYTVEFTAETLKKALIKHLKSDFGNLVKLEHQGSYLEGFVAMEHWIIEDENTVSPVYGLSLEDLGYNPAEVPVGTVMKTTFIQDEEFFNDYILTGKVTGYSIGGLFNLQAFSNQVDEMKDGEGTKIAELFLYLGVPQNTGEVLLKDKTVLSFAKDIKLGNEVVTDAEYQLFNGLNVVIKEGKLVDFGFSEEVIAEPTTIPVTPEAPEVVDAPEVVEEVVEEVIEPVEVWVDAPVEEVVAEVAPEAVIAPSVEPSVEVTEPSVDDKLTKLMDRLSLLEENIALKDKENANLKEQLATQPIKSKSPFKQNTQTVNSGKTLTIGGKTINV